MLSPALFNAPLHGPKTGIDGLTPYCARKVAGFVAQIIATAPGDNCWPIGKLKLTPPPSCHVFVGNTGSYKSTFVCEMFTSSTNSDWVADGLYITSLITTGPTRGSAFA